MKKWILLTLTILGAYFVLLWLETSQINKEKDEIIIFLASKGFSDLEIEVSAETSKLCAPFDRPYTFKGNVGTNGISGILCKSNSEMKYELNKE